MALVGRRRGRHVTFKRRVREGDPLVREEERLSVISGCRGRLKHGGSKNGGIGY